MILDSFSEYGPIEESNDGPLKVDEVMNCLRHRWKATYDLKLIVRKKCLYLQVMWAYLEQQSFPLDEEAYRERLNSVLEVINRLGLSGLVRYWLHTVRQRPRIGRAVTLPLENNWRFEEFVM